jgi:hypothetical protein
VKDVTPVLMVAIVPNVRVGKALTVPLTATFRVVAPVEATVTLPLGEPIAVAAILTKMVVLATFPPFGVKVTVLPKPEPDVVLNSKPVGATMVILFVKPLPLTVKLCWVAAVPAQAEKAVGVPVVLRVGPELTVTLPVILAEVQPAAFLTVKSKAIEVPEANELKLTEIGLAGNAPFVTAVMPVPEIE